MKTTWILVTLALAGCEVTYEPDVGDLQPLVVDAGIEDGAHVIGRCEDSDPATPVSFSRDVRPLLSRSPGGCQSCHGTSTTSGFNLGTYESLRRGGQNSGTRIIIAGEPCGSILPQKLGLAPPYGARMPYNGPPFFTAEELGKVRDWIAEGASNN